MHSLESPPFEGFDSPMNLHGVVGTHSPEVRFQWLHARMPHDLLKVSQRAPSPEEVDGEGVPEGIG